MFFNGITAGIKVFARFLSLLTLLFFVVSPALAQEDSVGTIRKRGVEMAEKVEALLREKYYDPNFRGIDLKAKFAEARQQIKQAQTNAEVYTIIAQVVSLLDDSHTVFLPPRYTKVVDYGFRAQIIGNTCLVVAVKKGSDAEAKGVKVGDRITFFHSFVPTRQTFWQIEYIFYLLNPQKNLKLKIQPVGAPEKELTVEASIRELKEVDKERKKKKEAAAACHELTAEIVVCQLRSFLVEPSVIEKMMRQTAGKKSLILDLRGNSGGYVKTTRKLISYFFDRKVKVGTVKGRRDERDEYVEPNYENRFGGQLAVLIDSDSASAAEVFARVIQLEKRGTVIGDKSAGMVMTSQIWESAYIDGTYYQNITFFALNVTVFDLIMTDGKSLEKTGVSPNVLSLPSALELVQRRDRQLSFAAGEFGHKISPADAGKIFPREEETEKIVDEKEGKEKAD